MSRATGDDAERFASMWTEWMVWNGVGAVRHNAHGWWCEHEKAGLQGPFATAELAMQALQATHATLMEGKDGP